MLQWTFGPEASGSGIKDKVIVGETIHRKELGLAATPG